MKKLSFVLAMVFVGSYAMAQFTEPVVSTVTVPTTPTFSSNTIINNQIGDLNKANVSQTGVNYATIDQRSIIGATLGKSNTTNLSQSGVQNKAIIDQNRSGGQQGSQTVATAIQSGDNNYLNIIQDGYYQGGNLSQVTQIGIQNGIGNKADVNHQKGYGNNWVIYQKGDGNNATQKSTSDVVSGTTNTINQYGVSNIAAQYTAGGDAMIATINQGTVLLGATGNIAQQTQAGIKSQATITQLTSNNKAFQAQYGGSYHFNGVYASQHNAQITQQGGENNYALQYQTENVAGAYDNSRNTSIILQNGSNNRAEVAQNNGLNVGNITQNSNYNQAKLIQDGLGNNAIVLQKTGNTNKVNLSQSSGAQADIVQDGANNTLMGLDIDIMATSLNGSSLDLDQIGSGNILHLQQTNGASSTVMQNGASNIATVSQN